MAVGYGVDGLEEVGGPDARDSRHDVFDSTGAGDALAGGFLFGLLNRRSPNECSNLAFVMALSASSQLGARVGLPAKEALAVEWRKYLSGLSAPSWLEEYSGDLSAFEHQSSVCSPVQSHEVRLERDSNA
jgi:hypothetical protein